MRPAYHPSEYKDEHIAFWLIAHVHKLDTHAKWSAEWYSHRDDGGITTTGWLFRDFVCDSAILHEYVKRGLVSTVEKDVTEHILDGAWMNLEETINCCRPVLVFPVTTESVKRLEEYREPNSNLWFEIVIDNFTEESVNFSLTMWGYKYKLTNLNLPKQLYYIFADRLDAKIRFVHEWFTLETVSRQLQNAIGRGKILPSIDSDLTHELSLLRRPTDGQIQASCRSLFPLLERAMRNYIEKTCGRKAGTLDDLIRRFESGKTVSSDTIELLRYVMKPKRDFVEHGRALPPTIAKLVLTTILDILSRFGDVDA